MQDAFCHILAHLPFPVQEVHPDNGSEFFNYHLLRFWGEAAHHIQLSRSRPFHKHALSAAEGNDNPFVEQKHSSLIRAYLGFVVSLRPETSASSVEPLRPRAQPNGHERLDTVAQTLLLHELYEKMGWYYNLFQPVLRVVEKVMVPGLDGQPDRLARRYDVPRTPFERLCETEAISDQAREQLMILRDSLNPRKLREEIYRLREELFALPNAVEGITENVHETLHYPLDLEAPRGEGDQATLLDGSCPPAYNEH